LDHTPEPSFEIIKIRKYKKTKEKLFKITNRKSEFRIQNMAQPQPCFEKLKFFTTLKT